MLPELARIMPDRGTAFDYRLSRARPADAFRRAGVAGGRFKC